MSPVRVFHLTARALTIQRWIRGRVAEAFVFDATPEGAEALARYLSAEPDEPVLLLADLVEEEFATETVPHVSGRERRQLLARRGERLFRATPLRTAIGLRRQRDGRRDDRILFSALTRPETVTPWIDRLMAARVPVQAISSVPHLCAGLPHRLGLSEEQVLIVTLQEEGARQTFFQEGELRVSRLSPPVFDAARVIEEIARTRRYLHNALLLPVGATLHVYLLAPESRLGMLEGVALPEGLPLRLCAMEEVSARLGIPYCATLGPASLYAGLFVRSRANRYGQAPHLIHERSRRVRLAVEVGGMAIALLLSLVAVTASLDALDSRRAALDSATELGRLQNAAAQVPLEPLPDALTPDQLRARVESAERIARIDVGPAPALALLGRTLLKHPGIGLHRVEWTLSPEDSAIDPPPAENRAPAQRITDAYPAPDRPRHLLVIEGRVAGGDLRRALDAYDRFAAALKEPHEVLRVDRVASPIDPEGALQGAAGHRRPPPADLPFSIRVVVQP